ncbi:hypothetical protein [Micromonospora sp. CPCC 206061]|uniref:hypothetical protein n=1 Tax=Micromonospora sp. CPCC 206061 TaxID=3122410 RepID=UPI002FEEB566
MTDTNRPTTAQRFQDSILVIIVLFVGVMAGAASFTHVHDWTMQNSPGDTGDWFGWANAVITELIPTAALIVIARRRRTGSPIGYPMFLLVIAVGLSLTAQLAVAQPTVFGWMVSALPALAFFALSKLVFTTTRPTNPVQAPSPATDAPATSNQDTAPAPVHPEASPTTTATPVETDDTPHQTEPKQTESPAVPEPMPAKPDEPTDPPARLDQTVVARLPHARLFANSHEQATGERINPGQLAVRLQVPTATARDILTLLYPEPSINPGPHNGTSTGVTR